MHVIASLARFQASIDCCEQLITNNTSSTRGTVNTGSNVLEFEILTYVKTLTSCRNVSTPTPSINNDIPPLHGPIPETATALTPAIATCTTHCQCGGLGESTTHDGSPGGEYEGLGWICWWNVSPICQRFDFKEIKFSEARVVWEVMCLSRS